MGRGKLNYEVVNESEYTDFSERNRLSGGIVTGAAVVTASLATYAFTRPSAVITADVIPAIIPETSTTFEPLNVLATPDLIPVNSMYPDVIQTGFIAESSLNVLATVLDPLIEIMVAISFPIASVIMVGACFHFMFGNDEKGWTTIMRAATGYCLIQLSPLFLKMLKEIGSAL